METATPNEHTLSEDALICFNRIVRNVNDITLRRVFADKLIDDGAYEWGSFITASIESGLAFYPESTGEPPPFCADPDGWPGWWWAGRNGFVDVIHLPIHDFYARKTELFCTFPLAHVIVEDAEPVQIGQYWNFFRNDPETHHGRNPSPYKIGRELYDALYWEVVPAADAMGVEAKRLSQFNALSKCRMDLSAAAIAVGRETLKCQ